jgi:hypothetical protein
VKPSGCGGEQVEARLKVVARELGVSKHMIYAWSMHGRMEVREA